MVISVTICFFKGGNMFHKFSINQAILTVGIALVAQSAFSSTVMTVCPSTEMLKKFDGDYTESHPTCRVPVQVGAGGERVQLLPD
jgi:hypothetical protein